MRKLLLFLFFLPGVAFAQMSAPSATVAPPSPQPLDNMSDLSGVVLPVPQSQDICAGYPLREAVYKIAGDAIVAFTVTEKGTVANARIEKSSGNDELDRASILCVQGWLFSPATYKGVPKAIDEHERILWKDFDDSSATKAKSAITVPVWSRGGFDCIGWYMGSRLPPRAVVMSFFVETDGSTKDVTVIQSSGNPDIDGDAVKCLSKRTYIPAKRDGAPVEVHISDWLY